MSEKRPFSPVFILGAPRSGTTLLRAMLNRHPSFAICDETYYFYYVFHRQRAFGDLRSARNRERLVTRYLETERVSRLGLDTAALRVRLLERGVDYGELFKALLEFYAESHGKSRCGEKTPQHAYEAARLRDLFPHAVLIHLVRDPRDVTASLLRMPWGRGAAANARLWRECVAGAEACADRGRFARVAYEALVADPETELRRLCGVIGEDFHDAMLRGEPGLRADRWWFQRAQEPVTTTRVEKWRSELTAAQVAVVEWLAGPWMEALGYARHAPPARLGRKALATVGLLADVARNRFGRLPSLWYRWLRPTQLAAEEARIDRRSARGPD